MNVDITPTPNAQTLVTLECLRQAVSKALERKSRLGHYSVLWLDNSIVIAGDDAPEVLTRKKLQI
jgi:hypothetical protein